MILASFNHENKINPQHYGPESKYALSPNSNWMQEVECSPILIQTQIQMNVFCSVFTFFSVFDVFLFLFLSLSTEDWDSGWRDGAVKEE